MATFRPLQIRFHFLLLLLFFFCDLLCSLHSPFVFYGHFFFVCWSWVLFSVLDARFLSLSYYELCWNCLMLDVASAWVFFIICIDGSLVRVMNVIRLILEGHIPLNNKNEWFFELDIFVDSFVSVAFLAKLWDIFMEKVSNFIVRIPSQFIIIYHQAAYKLSSFFSK